MKDQSVFVKVVLGAVDYVLCGVTGIFWTVVVGTVGQVVLFLGRGNDSPTVEVEYLPVAVAAIDRSCCELCDVLLDAHGSAEVQICDREHEKQVKARLRVSARVLEKHRRDDHKPRHENKDQEQEPHRHKVSEVPETQSDVRLVIFELSFNFALVD